MIKSIISTFRKIKNSIIFNCLTPNPACSADRPKGGHLKIIELRRRKGDSGGQLFFRGRSVLLAFILFIAVTAVAQNPNVLPESTYPYWPSYQHLDIEDLDTIQAQKWICQEHVINCWDWSLPGFVEPSPRSLVGLQRNIGWDKDFIPLNLQFKYNSIGILWVKWRDIEPVMGNYDFSPIINRIKQANKAG